MASNIQQPEGNSKYSDKEILHLSNNPEIKFMVENHGISSINNSSDDENLRVFSCINQMGSIKFNWNRCPRFGGGMERTRIYHVWPGKNVFFFGGRLICGPDPRGFLLTTISIILSSWTFCMYIGDDLSKHSHLIVTFTVILTVIVLVNLIMVSTTDPGIIPRNDQSSLDEVGTSDGPKSKRMRINGVEVKLKYCKICKIFRPPRSSHCAICDNCVEKFDHHCPWIGQCIGLRNYRFYLMFISSALIFFIYLLTFSCRRVNQKMSETGMTLFRTLRNCPEMLALATFCFVAMWFLGGLVGFHVYLIMLNQTAYENFRQRFNNSLNPYDKGKLGNIKEILFGGLPDSRINFRAEITSRGYLARSGF